MDTIDPETVRFSQDRIKATFRDGGTIDQLAEELRNGSVNAEDVEPIRPFERDGKFFTLDNRRLEAFRQAGVPVLYGIATPEEVRDETWKFTTRNQGVSIRVG
jgi:hypothetical protein